MGCHTEVYKEINLFLSKLLLVMVGFFYYYTNRNPKTTKADTPASLTGKPESEERLFIKLSDVSLRPLPVHIPVHKL